MRELGRGGMGRVDEVFDNMLGRSIADPDGIEGPPASVEGLGLLEIETALEGDKRKDPAARAQAARTRAR